MSAFVKFDGLNGESTDTGHNNWMDVQSVSSAIHRSIPSGAKDHQRFKGETSLGDIQLVRQLDKASPKIQQACATGKVFATVEIELCTTKEGVGEEPYLNYKLYDVILSSYDFHGDSSGNPLPFEQVSLNYSKVEWTYKTSNKDGSSGGDVLAGYDLGKNEGL
jgi:type VI secretion system secreted protein Hcp